MSTLKIINKFPFPNSDATCNDCYKVDFVSCYKANEEYLFQIENGQEFVALIR